MVVHSGKSEVMTIGTQGSLKNSNDLNIFTHDRRLKEVANYKYLGVYVDLTWKASFIYATKNVCKNPSFPDYKRSIEDL